MNNDLKKEYFRWIVWKVKNPEWVKYDDCHYWMMLTVLNKIEFYTLETVPRDDNREGDARKLRKEFLEEKRIADGSDIEGPCSLLEVMVALAIRMDTDVCGSPEKGDRAWKWFWIMVGNIDLLDQKDGEPGLSIDKCYQNGQKVVERTYEGNGKGSLFGVILTPNDPNLTPNEHKKAQIRGKNAGFGVGFDAKGVEIWYQMLWWYSDNRALLG